MALIDEFKIIYYNNQTSKVIPFLQKLSDKEKKELARDLKPLAIEREKHNKNIFIATALVCCTKTQYRAYLDNLWGWTWGVGMEFSELIDEVLAWNCPGWLSEYYNKRAEDEWGALLSYRNLMNWFQKGYLSPSPQLIAKSLAGSVSVWDSESRQNKYKSQIFDLDPVTLDEHIWTLFQYDTNCYNDIWKNAFKELAHSKRIDKQRVLKECLLTVNIDFKNYVAGWFTDLFVFMEPTKEDLLQIQDELFISFMSKFSKMINKSLDEVKKIASHKDFHIDDFILRLPLLLSSETKSIVASSLMVLEKAAAACTDKREMICVEIAPVFLNKDEAIQTRAAKIITKYGSPDSVLITSTLLNYADSLLMSVKPLLLDYLTDTGEVATTEELTVSDNLQLDIFSENNRVPQIDTFDDLLFFLPLAFKDKQPYYRDLLLPTMVKLNHLINETNIEQLEVALRQAYEVTLHQPFWHSFHHKTNEFESSSFWGEGLSYHWATLFFINYCQYVANKYPEASAFIFDMHKEAVDADKNRTFRSKYLKYYRQLLPQKEWVGKEYKVFRPYYHISLTALTYIEKGIDLPLLSTPTHIPAWIKPEILIERLIQYQNADALPDTADLEMSLLRCPSLYIEELINLADKLNNKYKELVLSYFSEKETELKKKSFLSILSKEEIPCNRKRLTEYYNSYSWKIGDQKKKDSTWTERTVLEVNIPASPWKKADNLYSGIADNIRYCIGPTDVKQFVFSYPSLAALPFAQIVKDRFEFAQIGNAETRDFLQEAVEALYELKIEPDAASLLFLACCMLCSEKNIRNYAAEIWLERTSSGLLDNMKFGKVIGNLEKSEWSPLKRLTDLITDNLMGVSGIHNEGLEQMIIGILSQMDKPVTNTKKLLEIYSELLALNNSKADLENIPQLNIWLKENSLKKVVQQIIK